MQLLSVFDTLMAFILLIVKIFPYGGFTRSSLHLFFVLLCRLAEREQNT